MPKRPGGVVMLLPSASWSTSRSSQSDFCQGQVALSPQIDVLCLGGVAAALRRRCNVAPTVVLVGQSDATKRCILGISFVLVFSTEVALEGKRLQSGE